MIAVEKALSLINNHVGPNGTSKTGILNALGSVLSEDIISEMALPPFRQSAMDGFAIRSFNGKKYRIKGEVEAGSTKEIRLEEGESVRIYTGAEVPDDADKVIMKEHVEEHDKTIIVKKESRKTNIKPPGEQIEVGDIALHTGSGLNTASLAFLASLGVDKVQVYKKPKVAVLVTGNELLLPGKPWERGKIYDSNSFIFRLLLKKIGIEEVRVFYVKDSREACNLKVAEVVKDYDFIIASGGISVGDYDLMRDAFHYNQVDEVFYKINQKPGKPIFFGKKGKTTVFGLPGNPAACFINFQVYVLPALKKCMGKSMEDFRTGIAQARIENTSGKALFLRGKCVDGRLEVFKNQSSSMLKSLVEANVLIYVPEHIISVEIGQEVQYLNILQ